MFSGCSMSQTSILGSSERGRATAGAWGEAPGAQGEAPGARGAWQHMDKGTGTSAGAAAGTVSPSWAVVWQGWKGPGRLCRGVKVCLGGAAEMVGLGRVLSRSQMCRTGCIVCRTLQDSSPGAWLASGYGAGHDLAPGAAALPPGSLLCPQGELLPWGAPHSPFCSWGGGKGLLCASLHPWLSPWYLCSIAALAVAVAGLGCGLSPAVLHASFGPSCGSSEFLCGTPVIPCAAWSTPTLGSGDVTAGQHLPHLHLCCCALAALPGPLWEKCPLHCLVAAVTGSEGSRWILWA